MTELDFSIKLFLSEKNCKMIRKYQTKTVQPCIVGSHQIQLFKLLHELVKVKNYEAENTW